MDTNVIHLAARAAALGRPLAANTDIPDAGPMPAVGSLGWLMAEDSVPLCFGEVISVGCGPRGDMLTVLDADGREPEWYSGFIRDFVTDDTPEGGAA